MGRGDFDVYSLLRALRCIPQRHQRQFDTRRVLSHERRKASIQFGSEFEFRAKLVARLVHACRQSLVTEVGSISVHSKGNHTHVSYKQSSKARHHRLLLGVNTHQTSDTEMRNCDVSSLGSAFWCQADAQHQLRIGSVQTAHWEDQQAKSSQHSKDRARNTLRKPTQHFGTKQDAIVSSKARSLAARSGRHPSCMLPICSRVSFLGRGR